MKSVQLSVESLLQMAQNKTQDFINHIDSVHMVWLEEIRQVASQMFSRDVNSEPELMPKTPSQKKNSRRKRVSVGRQEESRLRRRLSKHRRSNLRGSSVTPLNLIAEDVSTAESSTSTRPKRTLRKTKQAKTSIAEDESQPSQNSSDVVDEIRPELVLDEKEPGLDGAEDIQSEVDNVDIQLSESNDASRSPGNIPTPSVSDSIPASERSPAERAAELEPSPVRTAAKIAIANKRRSSRRSSVKVCHSRASLRNSVTKESLRRTSRRSTLKKNAARNSRSIQSSINEAASSCECVDEMEEIVSEAVTEEPEVLVVDDSDDPSEMHTTSSELPSLMRVTRSVAAHSPKLAPPSLFTPVRNNWQQKTVGTQQTPQAKRRSSRNNKRKAPYTTAESPKRFSPPKKSQSVVRPNMKSFLHTVQKNQILMMTPNSFNRTSVIKSFIKHTTPLKMDSKAKERQKLEALRKKQEQEEERMRKLEEEKKKKQDEYKRKRDERLRKVYEAKVKEELREEEKKKKIEQKMAHIDEKNDKRQAAELAKKRLAIKRQEDIEQKRKLEEETKRKKLQQEEEEKRQQELLTKKAKEEELKAKKLVEARKALELKREQDRERELEKERFAAAEREKAVALQRELEKAAREKEKRELEEKRVLEEKRKCEQQQKRLAADKDTMAKEAANTKTAAALNVTVDIEHSVMSTPAAKVGGLNKTVVVEKSPQSYLITPKGNNKTMNRSDDLDDYGMDQNSDDSTDDESAPKKPIPSWAQGHNLEQLVKKQYFNPPDLETFFGIVEEPKLEYLFNKNKPRYFKRTSSAVWHSPPNGK
ncbi:inner centromere protein isoform X2 [Stigmatopora argus]